MNPSVLKKEGYMEKINPWLHQPYNAELIAEKYDIALICPTVISSSWES